jgi:hypothetical protein
MNTTTGKEQRFESVQSPKFKHAISPINWEKIKRESANDAREYLRDNGLSFDGLSDLECIDLAANHVQNN